MTAIVHHAESNAFFLQGATSSYVLRVLPGGRLVHLHWGGRVEPCALDWSQRCAPGGCPFSPEPSGPDRGFSLDLIPREAPTHGNGDFRAPMLSVRHGDGSHVVDLRYRSHAITQGKPRLDGLPATYVEAPGEATTLAMTLVDDLSGLEVQALYTVFHGTDALARSWRAVNRGPAAVTLTRALSASVDLPGSDWRLLQLSGAWARERQVIERPLRRAPPRSRAGAAPRATSTTRSSPCSPRPPTRSTATYWP